MDEAALRRLLSSSHVARELARKAVAVESAWKRIATEEHHVDTGRYRGSIAWRLGQDGLGMYAEIGSAVPYAAILEEGSRPHVIVPRRKRALYWKGARHPVRRVNHPGTPGYHMGRRALEAARLA
jgi:hypothetical protein